MQQSRLSLLFCFCVLSLWPPSFLFPLSPFASGINVAWDERYFVCASRFPDACVSERQISRVFWTVRNSRFPMFTDQKDIRSSYFFPRVALESFSYSPDYIVDTLCRKTRQRALVFTFNGNWVKSFLRIFSRNEFLRKVKLDYRILSFPAISTQLNVFLLQMFLFFL